MKFLIVEPSSLPICIPFGKIICLKILFSNTLSLHSSLNVRDYVSQPYNTTGNIIVLYIYLIKHDYIFILFSKYLIKCWKSIQLSLTILVSVYLTVSSKQATIFFFLPNSFICNLFSHPQIHTLII